MRSPFLIVWVAGVSSLQASTRLCELGVGAHRDDARQFFLKKLKKRGNWQNCQFPLLVVF